MEIKNLEAFESFKRSVVEVNQDYLNCIEVEFPGSETYYSLLKESIGYQFFTDEHFDNGVMHDFIKKEFKLIKEIKEIEYNELSDPHGVDILYYKKDDLGDLYVIQGYEGRLSIPTELLVDSLVYNYICENFERFREKEVLPICTLEQFKKSPIQFDKDEDTMRHFKDVILDEGSYDIWKSFTSKKIVTDEDGLDQKSMARYLKVHYRLAHFEGNVTTMSKGPRRYKQGYTIHEFKSREHDGYISVLYAYDGVTEVPITYIMNDLAFDDVCKNFESLVMYYKEGTIGYETAKVNQNV